MLNESAAQLRGAVGLPDLLTAGFLAFEDIRMASRGCEDRAPELLATFMTAADAAVAGREALAAAPSLTWVIADGRSGSIPADGDVMTVIEALGFLGGMLRSRLADGATMAAVAGDREACLEAAEAARRICILMARDDDDGCPG